MSHAIQRGGDPPFGQGAESPAPALELEGIFKSYPGVQVLSDVSIRLPRHQVLGLVGENGAGKSTIISIVNGTVRPDGGSIRIHGDAVAFGHPVEAARHGVATVFQEQGLVPNLRVFENVFLGREERFNTMSVLHQRRMLEETRSVLQELEIDIDPTALTSSLSFGQRQLVEVAKAFALQRVYPVEPIILLDEPTSALSDREAAKLFAGIEHWRTKASFILVSHRLSDVFRACDEVVALKDGHVMDQRPIGEITEGELHQLIVGRKRDEEYYRELRQRNPEPTVAISIRNAHKAGVLHGVSFDIRHGEIVGVAGVLGSGKSDLAQIVAGVKRPDGGEIAIDGNPIPLGSSHAAKAAGIGYVPAERTTAGIIGAHSVEWNMVLPGLPKLFFNNIPLISPRKSGALTDEWIRILRIRTPTRGTLAKNLSGGNQQKVVFAKWLSRGTKILVLDDPGRGLDVGAKEEIYSLIRDVAEQGAAVLLISDNLPELIGLSNRILVLRGGVQSAEFAAPFGAKPQEADIVAAMV